MNTCDRCTYCCKLKGITELDKRPGVWCRSACTKSGRGCSIYDTRPQSCRDYSCYWLSTQSGKHPMPLAFRPDKSRVLIDTATERMLCAVVDDKEPLAFLREPVWTFLNQSASHRKVYVQTATAKRVWEIYSPMAAGMNGGVKFRELDKSEIQYDGKELKIILRHYENAEAGKVYLG